jgi:TetR/AcrR family transcriptional regulator, transcriptional repressor for nem operon
MRYTTEYKENARVKLLEASGSYAKKHGFSSSGMADLAAAAGVTTGSLYKHFNGKSDFFVALLTAELKRTADLYASVDPTDNLQVKRTLGSYLSMSHVAHPKAGCPLPSLTPEISRADDAVKEAFEKGLESIHKNVNALTGDASAMNSEVLQRELLNAVLQAGENLISSDKDIHTSEQR